MFASPCSFRSAQCAALIALGLTDNLGDSTILGVMAGVGIAFVGVTMLTPIISRPLVAILGALMSWSLSGKLGRLNAGRNPRRTAITASALMIAVALITGIATIVSSLKATTAETLELNMNSDLIVSGEVGLIQFSDIAEFTGEGARLKSGATIPADLVVLATGYKGQDHLVRKLFGDAVADRVGPIWGFGDGHELRNMFTRTPQPGL